MENNKTPHSLFEDEPVKNKAKKNKITRQGAKNQMRTLFVVVGIIIVFILVFIFTAGKPSEYGELKNVSFATIEKSDWKDVLELSATIEISDSVSISAPERGILEKVLVEEGDWVKKGQTIAILSASDLETNFSSLKRDLSSRERAVQKIEKEAEYKKKSFTISKSQATRDLETQNASFELTQKLFNLGSASKDELETARTKKVQAEEKLQSIDLDFEQTSNQNQLSLLDAKANLESTKTEISDLAERIASLRITAPIEGRVLEIADAAREKGKLLSQYASILSIANTKMPLAKAKLPETSLAKVKLGTKLSLTTNNGVIAAEVARIGVLVKTDSSTYGTYLDLYVKPIDKNVELNTGSSVSLSMDLGQRKDVIQIPRGPWFSGSTQGFVFVLEADGLSATKRKVTIGSVNTEKVEIISGLKEGEQIVTSSYQSIVSYEKIKLIK